MSDKYESSSKIFLNGNLIFEKVLTPQTSQANY